MTDELGAMVLRVGRVRERLQREVDAGNVRASSICRSGRRRCPPASALPLAAAIRSRAPIARTATPSRGDCHSSDRAVDPERGPQPPVLFIEQRDSYDDEEDAPAEWDARRRGEAVVRRPGGDDTVVAASRMTGVALAAAERLSREGVDAEVIDLRTVSPLDLETVLASVRRTGAVTVIDDSHTRCGIARGLAVLIAEAAWSSLRTAPAGVAAPDRRVRFSPPLARRVLPDVERVATIGRALANRR